MKNYIRINEEIKTRSNVSVRLHNEYIMYGLFSEYIKRIDESIYSEFVRRFINLINVSTIKEVEEKDFIEYCLSFCKEINMENPLLKHLIMVTKKPVYNYYKIFIEIYGRERGIQHIKLFIDQTIIERKGTSDPPKNVMFVVGDQKQEYPTEAIDFIFNVGKVATKITRCLWNEILSDLEDKDVAYLTSCYPDFAGFEANGKSFHLTRNYCLLLGDMYCDPCAHDKRYNDKISHPVKEFYDSLE